MLYITIYLSHGARICLVLSTFEKELAHWGTVSHFWAVRTGAYGTNPSDSRLGRPFGGITAVSSALNLHDSWEIRTLGRTSSFIRGSDAVLRFWLRCAACVMGSVAAEAQTRYDDPPSVALVPDGSTRTSAELTRSLRVGIRHHIVCAGYAGHCDPGSLAIEYSRAPTLAPGAQTTSAAQIMQISERMANSEAGTGKSGLLVIRSEEARDPYGFIVWLNATRVAYGLAPVGYDANLSDWAALNNSHQSSLGIGHFVMGPARRQNSAVGSFPGIEAMWMASPAHRAALLDPTIRWIGIAGLGAYWTFNAK